MFPTLRDGKPLSRLPPRVRETSRPRRLRRSVARGPTGPSEGSLPKHANPLLAPVAHLPVVRAFRTERRPCPFEAHAPDALPTGGTTPFRPAFSRRPAKGVVMGRRPRCVSPYLRSRRLRGSLRVPATELPAHATADLRREAEHLRPGELAPLGPTRCAQRDAPSTSGAARFPAASEGGLMSLRSRR